MLFPTSLISLAGFTFAHATWSLSDLQEGELLCPLALLESAGRRELLRFESESQEEAIAEAKRTLAAKESIIDAWAFAREGQFAQDGEYIDVLTVEAKASGEANTIAFLQRFQPFASGQFALIGEPLVLISGVEPSESDSISLLAQLYAGVRTHERAAEHWSTWKSA
jgi:hypothetical protein